MTSFPLRLPDELKALAASQAGVSLNQYIASLVVAHVGAQAEAERYFAARAARTRPGSARTLLAGAGRRRTPRAGDRLEDG
ncbi:MAG: toxin-antitoxin system HicB family antitoxin [Acetobacteraceae bacterium]